MNRFQKNANKIVILAVMAGSTSGILAKLITASSMAIGFYRLSFALPFFAIHVLIKHRDELANLSAKDILWCALAGAFLFGHFFTWFTAVNMTTIASAAILAALHPLVVLLVTILFFKQKVGIKAICGIIVALLGAAIIGGSDYAFVGDAVLGDVMAFLAAVCMGLYFCVGQRMRVKVPGATYVFLVFASCWLCFTLGMVATQTPFLGYPISDYLWLIVMTILCQIGAHAVMNWSMGYVSSLYVSAWETADAIFATILAAIIFVEIPSLWQLVGGVIVIAGLLYYNFNEGKK